VKSKDEVMYREMIFSRFEGKMEMKVDVVEGGGRADVEFATKGILEVSRL
jgi:hypothetical protein